MSYLTKSSSLRSTLSTESFDSFEANTEPESFAFAPHNIYYNIPESDDRLLIVPQGEPLPVLATKYKKKKEWTYGLKFRFVMFFLSEVLDSNLFSVTDQLDVKVLKRLDMKAPTVNPVVDDTNEVGREKTAVAAGGEEVHVVAKKSRPAPPATSGGGDG